MPSKKTTKQKTEKQRWGRKAGTPNKRTQAVEDMLAKLGVDPLEFMALVIQGKTKYKMMIGTDRDGEPIIVNDYPPLHIQISCVKELAQYVAPKRKALEIDIKSEQIVTVQLITEAKPELPAPKDITPTNGTGVRV